MVSVLLLTSFVTNVYAAEDFPTSDLGVPSSGEFNEVKITLSGFPGQTGESVTDVDLIPSPCSVQNDIICTGSSDITIPGIGDGNFRLVIYQQIYQLETGAIPMSVPLYFYLIFSHYPVMFTTTEMDTLVGSTPGENVVTVPITFPDVGTGLLTIQLL
jgi:hypothetical protein